APSGSAGRRFTRAQLMNPQLMNHGGDLRQRLFAHLDKPAFAQAAKPGFLAAGELVGADFDAFDARGEGFLNPEPGTRNLFGTSRNATEGVPYSRVFAVPCLLFPVS